MSSQATGVIGRGVAIQGRLTGAEPLVIEGTLEGTVSLDAALTVEAGARVAADVEAESVDVGGEVEGNVDARETIVVRSGGRVVGDMRAPRVVIEDGAIFSGSIEMDFELPEGV